MRALIGCLLLAGCAPADPCAGYDDCWGLDMTASYVLSTAGFGAGEPAAVGFDLDGLPGSGTGERCDGALDFTSSVSGTSGVDNQLGAHATGLPDAPDLRAVVEGLIARGELLFVLEVNDIRSFTASSVNVRLVAEGLPEGVTAPLLDERGRIVPGQTFVQSRALATIPAMIVDGRLELDADTLPIVLRIGGADVPITFRTLHISAAISELGLTDGELGADLDVLDLVSLFEALGSPVSEDELRATLRPDLDPRPGDPMTCDGVSLGLSFEAVTVANL